MAKQSNIRINEDKLRKMAKTKLKLKRVAASFVIVGIAVTSGILGNNIYKNIEVPEGYEHTGVNVSISQKLKLDDVEKGQFTLLEASNWSEGINQTFIDNISLCNANNIPCGVVINSNAQNKLEAKADAAVLGAIMENYVSNCPIYYNVDGIVDKNEDSYVLDIYNIFVDELNSSDTKYEVRLSATEDNLSKLGREFDSINKMVISDDKEIEYSGKYDTCYFTRTDCIYSVNDYSMDKPEIIDVSSYEDNKTKYELGKGIDVSQHQGDIDWETIKKENVDFAIIRFSSFHKYHDGKELKIDSKFFENVEQCEKLDIPYGVYCYTTASTVEEAEEEARIVVKYLKENNISPDLPIYYDIEGQFHFDNPDLSVEFTKAFLNIVENAGYKGGLYASYSLIKDMVEVDEDIKNLDKWVAYYKNNEKRDYDEVIEEHIPDMEGIGKYRIVQVTENGVINGIEENTVDVNFTVPESKHY